MPWNADAVEAFIHSIEQNERYRWAGRSPRVFGRCLGMEDAVWPDHYPEHVQTKHQLIEYLNGLPRPFQGNSSAAATTAILAWGGMRTGNFKRLDGCAHRDRVLTIVQQMADGEIDAFAGYKAFFHLGDIPGMGPAYYTKLIYFLGQPRRDGVHPFIMDQWTARSMNLLAVAGDDWQAIPMINGTQVSRAATPEQYLTFCQRIHALTDLVNEELHQEPPLTAVQIEEAMFSRGGRPGQRGAWRAYVIENG